MPELRAFLGQVWTILWKDLVCELRTKELFTAMGVFALLVLVVFNFAFELRVEHVRDVAPGALWVAFVFAGMLGLGRSFVMEKDRGALEGLLLAPIDRSAIYVAKVLANALYMLVVELVALPVFGVFFNLPVWTPAILPPVLLGTLGLAAVGTIFAAMAANTRAREVMLPVLLLPVAVPVLIAAVRATQAALGSGGPDAASWLNLLVVYDVLFLAVCFAVFEYVLEE